jgi:hypothetical protein
MMPTPSRLLSIDGLLDRLLVDNGQENLDELVERLRKKSCSEKTILRLLKQLTIAMQNLDKHDTDMISENKACRDAGKAYFRVRNKIQFVLSQPSATKLFAS